MFAARLKAFVLLLCCCPLLFSGEVQCRLELDRGVLPAGRTERALIKITLEGPSETASTVRRPPVNLAVVLDRSGSMKGDKLQKAREGTVQAMRQLGRNDYFSLVVYDDKIETLIPPRFATDTDALESRIWDIRAGGSTALFGGVSQGAAEVRKHVDLPLVHRVVLLSDGLANVGPASPGDLRRLGAALMKEGISVTTVGVGNDYSEDTMLALSQASDGNAYFAADHSQLPDIFAGELGDLLSVAARTVSLEVTCAEGVKPLRMIGRQGRIEGNKVTFNLNQLYAGQEKIVLVEIEIDAGSHDLTRELVRAEAVFRRGESENLSTVSNSVSARFSTDKKEVLASANFGVQKDYLMNKLADIQNQAVALADEGKNKEAAAVLEKAREELNKYGVRNSDEDLLKEARKVGSQAATLTDQGLTKANRKYLQTDSYQKQFSQGRFRVKTKPKTKEKPKEKPDPKKNEKKEKNKDSNQQN
ncbi:MAG: VWA domain-containing protein [Acidobacteriota bacterium]|nr:VWA domain-containing protein [Acidobacteriota bacterium]